MQASGFYFSYKVPPEFLSKTQEVLVVINDIYLCSHLHFSVPTAAAKKKEIMKLHESISTRSSKCHVTGNEKNSSGGW